MSHLSEQAGARERCAHMHLQQHAWVLSATAGVGPHIPAHVYRKVITLAWGAGRAGRSAGVSVGKVHKKGMYPDHGSKNPA